MTDPFLTGVGFGIGVTIGLFGLTLFVMAVNWLTTWLFGDPKKESEKLFMAIQERFLANGAMQIEVLTRIAASLEQEKTDG